MFPLPTMKPSLSSCLTLLFLTSILFDKYSAISSPAVSSNEALEYLCPSINKIHYISTMEKLIEFIREVKVQSSSNSSNEEFSTFDWAHLNTWLRDPKRPCLLHSDAMFALEDIIKEKKNVCSKGQIDKIEAYKRKYLYRGVKVTQGFFDLYVNQVSVVCKQHLLKSIRMAHEQLISPDDYNRVKQWLTPDQDCDKIQNDGSPIEFGTQEDESTHHSWFTINNKLGKSKMRCQAQKTLSSIKTIDDLAQAIECSRERTSAGETNEPELGEENDNKMFVLLVSDNIRPKVEDVLDTCGKFEQVYRHTIMPIVRLAQMGYNLEYQNLDKKYQEELLIQKWFIITLVCDSILSSRLAEPAYQEEFATLMAENEHGIIIVDQGTDVAPQLDKMANLFRYPIDDELWVGAYLPSLFRRKTSNFVKNVMKSLRIDDLSQNGVFKHRISRVYKSMLKLILISLAFAGLGSPIL